MTDSPAEPAALHSRVHLLRRRDRSSFVYLFYYFWTSEGGPTLLAMTLVPVTYVLFVLNALRENDLYPGLPPAANYVIAAVYIALRARRLLLHEHRILRRSAPSAPATGTRTDLFMGGADDAAGAGIFAQAPHAAVRPQHRADPLRGLRLRRARHVLSCGLELEARRHRDERRDHDRRVLQPAADRAHRGRRVPAGAERAAAASAASSRCCARPSASPSARRTRCRSRR